MTTVDEEERRKAWHKWQDAQWESESAHAWQMTEAGHTVASAFASASFTFLRRLNLERDLEKKPLQQAPLRHALQHLRALARPSFPIRICKHPCRQRRVLSSKPLPGAALSMSRSPSANNLFVATLASVHLRVLSAALR